VETLGDPAGIRQQAALVRTTADSVEALITRLDHDVQAMDFEGPAAMRARSAWIDRQQRARHVIAELREIAEHMVHEAHVVEERLAHGPGLG
jgi:Proteins of 100 residues with WXG